VRIADIPALFDHFVGTGKQRGRQSEAEYLGGLCVDDHPLRGRAYHQMWNRILREMGDPIIGFCLVRSGGDVDLFFPTF